MTWIGSDFNPQTYKEALYYVLLSDFDLEHGICSSTLPVLKEVMGLLTCYRLVMKHSGLLSRVCIFICTVGLLESCTNDWNKKNDSTTSKMKIQKFDIAGAKALAFDGSGADSKSTGNMNQLFKIDQDGNLTAVILEVSYEEDGTETTSRTDISVHPCEVYNISNAFTYFFDCRFFDGDGNEIWMRDYYEPDAFYFNILLQNSTGKICYIPEAFHSFFPSRGYMYDLSAVDESGNLYVRDGDYGHSGLAKVIINDDIAQFIRYDDIFCIPHGDYYSWRYNMYLLDNGTLLFLPSVDTEACDDAMFIYPDGNFEVLDGSSPDGRGDRQYDRLYFQMSDGKLMATKLPKENFQHDWFDDRGWQSGDYYLNEEVSIELVNIEVGTSCGSIKVSEPWAKLSGTNDILSYNEYRDLHPWQAPDWTYFARRTDWWPDVHVKDNRYCFISSDWGVAPLAHNIDTGEWGDLMKIGFNIQNLEGGIAYKEKIWWPGDEQAFWLDMKTFEFGEQQFNIGSTYTRLYTIEDVSHGRMIQGVVSKENGKKYIIIIDIETGECTQTEVDDDTLEISDTLQLFPLN